MIASIAIKVLGVARRCLKQKRKKLAAKKDKALNSSKTKKVGDKIKTKTGFERGKEFTADTKFR